jgi:hypothetical protein
MGLKFSFLSEDHRGVEVTQLAVFLADLSHAAIMILSLLAILVGFCRYSTVPQPCSYHDTLTTSHSRGILQVQYSIEQYSTSAMLLS